MILTPPPFPTVEKNPLLPLSERKGITIGAIASFLLTTKTIYNNPFLAETHVKTRSTLINLRVIAVEMISLLPPFYTTADFGVNDLFKYVLSTTEESSKLE